jgi:hypothetical protein
LNLLNDIIDEHFLSSDKEKLIALFNKYDIFETVAKTSEQLNIHLTNAINTNQLAPMPAIVATSSNFLVLTNSKVGKITNIKEKREIQEAVAQIGLRILLSIIKLFPKEEVKIFEAVIQSLQTTSNMFGYEFTDIKNLMKLDEFYDLIQTISGEKVANEIVEIKKSNKSIIIWTEKTHLDFLTNALKKRKWIKTQKEFSSLFGDSNTNSLIHWDMKFKYELAFLLYSLAKHDFIRSKKGFFSVSERIIVDFSGDKLKLNSLKKISSKITNDPSKYADVIKNVEELIKSIS